MYPAPGIIERVGADWDWIWIDGQHGQLGGYQDYLAMVRACNLIQRPAYVRVPAHETGWISMVLDTNAAGVIVPQVDTVEQAKAVVRAAKFPPLGNRSYGGRRPIDLLGRLYSNTANKDQMLICQIESEEALENADALAAVDGVDALFLGPDDMMLRKGYAMDQPRSIEVLGDCLTKVAKACQKHGKIAISVAVGDEMIGLSARLGVNWIVSGGDVPFLANTSKEASKAARESAKTALARTDKISTEGTAQPKTIY